MYWEQLELRCRSLYRPPTGQAVQTSGRPVQANCSCCAQCHPTQPAWDISMQHRFWTPGRIGNLYSPNPGTGRKTSAWSWFPWPRSNSQNSRCRRMGGVPQSGDSAYGFCDTDTNQNPNAAQYEDRSPYPSNIAFQRNQNSGTYPQNQGPFPQNPGSFPQNPGSFPQNPGSFPQTPGSFPQTPSLSQSAFAQSGFVQYVQEGFGEASGSFDASTGVWGPPPPYSPQGRSGSRHHLHQDPAAATLLHHHHMDAHRNMPIQDHTNLPMQSHACARNSYMMQHSLQQLNPELARLNPELARLNPELARLNPELARLNPEMIHLNPDLAHLSPELAHLAQLYPPEELARLQAELGHVQEGRFNTLRGHLVPYRACHPRSLGMSVGNLHRDCRMEDTLAIECLHQKSASKVSDQSSDSCQKLGKENLAFTNDKNSPVRNSMRNLNAESEVYFADVSSCCNVSVKADCCMNPNVSALVGTIENHPESTSESDTGSFTLTRQQRPQPQIGSKRRPRQEKHAQHLKTQEKLLNNSLRMNELTNSMRLNEQLNSSIRLTEQQIEQLNNSMRISEQLNNSLRMSDRMERNDSRDRLNERIERLSDRERDRISIESREKLNESRISERMNDSRIERMNESRMSDRMTHTRISDRANESRISDRMNDSRTSDRLNDSKMSDRIDERRLSDLNSSIRMDSPLRMARSSPKGFHKEHPRQSSSDSNKEVFVAPNLSPLSPKTEESLLSDDDRQDQAYNNEPESSRPKCLGPDSQYETVREDKEEVLKTNHHHCYSDTNTMDSGWQSGSEKQVTD
ncbi:hypothetical protein O0L34_g13274 [Tuta absoluta]|nr:hypothetical protein O0L34_g13274 [Tuta absoluta]